MGISGNSIQYKGLRNGFAVGNGRYILTAAHCVADFENSNQVFRQPMIISPYYGDIFEAEIVAVDDVNDIAILKPAWDSHPALELETSNSWKKSETLKVVGYPPIEPCRGGNGLISRCVMSEYVPLKKFSKENMREIIVGPVKYLGVGWSGSPFINPKTGKVVGIFCRYDTYQVKRYFFFKKKKILHSGPGIESIRRITNTRFSKNRITDESLSHIIGRNQFELILNYLDTLKTNNTGQKHMPLKKTCEEMPDSALLHIIAGWAFNPPEDKQYYQNAIASSPNSTLVHTAYGHHLLAYNNSQKAVEQFEIVTKQDPNHIFAYHGLLTALLKTDPNEAEVLGQELIQRWPDNAGFHFEYSKALRAGNRREEELPIIQKAVELCENSNVPFQYQRYLADSLKANKQYGASEQAYEKLLEGHECGRCWWAYTDLLLKMGPDKITSAKKARDKTMSFINDPNEAGEKQEYYEAAIEKILSDPNTPKACETNVFSR